jgi:hypothetical protein
VSRSITPTTRRSGVARKLAERVGLRSRHIDRFAPVLQERFASFRRAIADARAEVRTLRIAAERRFRHHDQLRAGVTDRARVAEDRSSVAALPSGWEPICRAAMCVRMVRECTCAPLVLARNGRHHALSR